jgi:GNAT superfamily N-acetyltransferase
MSRVIGDGQQFFYVMDVAVHPAHQGRGIGTALMNEIVACCIQRVAPPKALVSLFTSPNRGSFYERFGFRGPETGLYGMCATDLKLAR